MTIEKLKTIEKRDIGDAHHPVRFGNIVDRLRVGSNAGPAGSDSGPESIRNSDTTDAHPTSNPDDCANGRSTRPGFHRHDPGSGRIHQLNGRAFLRLADDIDPLRGKSIFNGARVRLYDGRGGLAAEPVRVFLCISDGDHCGDDDPVDRLSVGSGQAVDLGASIDHPDEVKKRLL